MEKRVFNPLLFRLFPTFATAIRIFSALEAKCSATANRIGSGSIYSAASVTAGSRAKRTAGAVWQRAGMQLYRLRRRLLRGQDRLALRHSAMLRAQFGQSMLSLPRRRASAQAPHARRLTSDCAGIGSGRRDNGAPRRRAGAPIQTGSRLLPSCWSRSGAGCGRHGAVLRAAGSLSPRMGLLAAGARRDAAPALYSCARLLVRRPAASAACAGNNCNPGKNPNGKTQKPNGESERNAKKRTVFKFLVQNGIQNGTQIVRNLF